MNLGFALVESGFCRAKNTVNILSKNFIVFAISCLAFYLFGWGLMFGNGSGFVGSEGLLAIGGADNSPATGDAYIGAYKAIAWTGIPLYAKFFFQLVFAGTAATIVSGSVAERIKYFSFIVFSFLLVAFVYPVTGHWIWGGGWLATAGFWDFAGSTVVHSVGGWAALAGILVLGPRLGKYGPDGKVTPIPGSQHDVGRHRLLRAVARLVRIQSRLDDGRGSQRDLPHLHDHEHGGVHGPAVGDGAQLDLGRQARSRHVGQRLPGRPGRHHRAVRVRDGQGLAHHRPARRADRRLRGQAAGHAEDRRSGRRRSRAPVQRRLRHASASASSPWTRSPAPRRATACSTAAA